MPLSITFDPDSLQDRIAIRSVCDAFDAGLHSHPGAAPAPPVDPADALKAQRQQQAAYARAAKAANTAGKPNRVSGGAGTNAAAQNQQNQAPIDLGGGTNGTAGDQDEDDDADALGLDAPSMSPGEAKDAALALVREAYSAGHVSQVKALQKELNVAKFYDVPVEQGHAFYARVMKLAQGVGLRQ